MPNFVLTAADVPKTSSLAALSVDPFPLALAASLLNFYELIPMYSYILLKTYQHWAFAYPFGP